MSIKHVILLCFLLCSANFISAQFIYSIKADSVKITNACDTAELIIENHSRHVPGFLFNKGNGRTEFRRGMISLSDSLYLFGTDTLNVNRFLKPFNGLSMWNGRVVLGNDVGDSSAALFSNREIPTKGYNIGFSGTGRIGIGTTTPDAKLNIYMPTATGSVGVFHVQGVDAYKQAFVLQASAADYTGNIFQTIKGYGSLGGAMGIGVNFASNVPQYFTVINNNSENLIRVTNENAFTGPSLRVIIGRNAVNTGQMLQVKGTASIIGNSIFGDTVNVPTAKIEIAAGSASANTAPLKFTAGSLMTTPEQGAVEYDGTDLYLTVNTTRYKLSKTLSGQITTDFGVSSVSAFDFVTTTLTVQGAEPGDAVVVNANSGSSSSPAIIVSAYVTSSNTVTLKAYNASNASVSIGSDLYKIRVIK